MKSKIERKNRIGKIGALVVFGMFLLMMLMPSVAAQDDDWDGIGTGNIYLHTPTDLVGIGTGSPDRKLHVEVDDATTDDATNLLRLTHTTSGTPAVGIGAGIEFEVEDASGNTVGAAIEGILTDVTNNAEKGALLFYTADIADDGLVERMRIDRDGRLGIGDTSPDFKLEVTGSSGSGYFGVSSSSYLDFLLSCILALLF